MKSWLTLVPIAFAAGAFVQQPPRDAARPPRALESASARITGRVVSETGALVPLARVMIVGSANDRPPERAPEIYTDDAGHFVFDGLRAGRYVVSARKPGFVTGVYGARRPGEPAVHIDLDDGERADVTIRLVRSAGISGRITDQYGEPIEGLVVTAERLVRSEGVFEARRFAVATTNDLGEYRVGGLAASRYVVNAWTDRGYVPSTIARTYFPGVIGLSRAQPIEVRAGEERGSIDFVAMPQTAVATLNVSFFDANGKPASGEASLYSVGATIAEFTTLPERGEQIAGRVQPGTWTVVGRGSAGVGAADVAIGSSDVSVAVTLGKGGHVAGKVETDDPLPGGRLSVAPGRVLDDPTTSYLAQSGPVRPDGTFEVSNLIGPMLFRVVPKPPPGWVLRGVFAGDRDVSDEPIDFKSGIDINDVRVVMTHHAAALMGTVVDAEGGIRVESSVLVFAEDRALAARPRRYARWVRPNGQGRFAIDDLLPGTYLVVAVDDVDDTQWMNGDYLDRFRTVATRVTLGDSEQKTMTLQLATP